MPSQEHQCSELSCSRGCQGSAQPPQGRGHGKKGTRTIWSLTASLGHSREGGMLRAGIHAEHNPPTQPGSSQGEQGAEHHTPKPAALTASWETLASKVCLKWCSSVQTRAEQLHWEMLSCSNLLVAAHQPTVPRAALCSLSVTSCLTLSTIRKLLLKMCNFYFNLSINLPVDFSLTAPDL